MRVTSPSPPPPLPACLKPAPKTLELDSLCNDHKQPQVFEFSERAGVSRTTSGHSYCTLIFPELLTELLHSRQLKLCIC